MELHVKHNAPQIHLLVRDPKAESHKDLYENFFSIIPKGSNVRLRRL